MSNSLQAEFTNLSLFCEQHRFTLCSMPSKGRKFITEFLLPNLNSKKFGSRLEWLDAEKKIFQMQWNHKAACDWKESDAAVFSEWDKHKGHYKPDDKEYFSKSKQRFRAVLYKFINSGYIKELKSKDRNTKIYCIDNKESIPSSYTAKIKKPVDINERISEKITATHPEEVMMDFSSFANNNYVFECEDTFSGYSNEVKEVVIESEEQVVNDNDENNILHSQLLCNNILNGSEQCNTIHITLLDFNGSFSKNEKDSKQSSISYNNHLFDQNRGVMWSDVSDKAELLDEEGIEIQKLIEETTPDFIPHAILWKTH
ncbi:interferon regulatory factor 2 [Trichonephila clavata]|uniref:Interferon regulatory factor 2 n=1 Tax=Trichonephila clavata TaxID=2740835 RepID=A0A8X6GCZ6_TRICU|nr:interferon regulatory factor 2 [Trichonephila clavata]